MKYALPRSARLVMPHPRPGAPDRSPPFNRPNSRSSSFDRSSSTAGSISRASTIRSPRTPVRVDGAPRSRSRKRWPDCVPGGIRTRTGPSRPSSSSRAPSAASCTRHRHRHVQVVAVPGEDRVRLDAHLDVQVARPAAPDAGIAFVRQPDQLPVRNARRNPRHQALGAHRQAGAVARSAGPRPLPAVAAARRARSREHHVSRGRCGPRPTRGTSRTRPAPPA